VPQVVIDPDHVGAPVGEVSRPILPERVRRFGFIPDLDALSPGDLILFRDRSSTLVGRAIASVQRADGFSDEHSAWTHVAIFLYDDFIVEAVPWPGIRTRSIYSDFPGRIMRVRRAPDLEERERYRIALRALRNLGARYSLLSALGLGWRRSRVGIFRPGCNLQQGLL
jgi:hypothetical protein